MHVGHGAVVGVGVECVVVIPHTLRDDFLASFVGRGSTGSSSISAIALKAFVDEEDVVDGGGEGGVWEGGGGGEGLFFFFLSFLYMRVGFV